MADLGAELGAAAFRLRLASDGLLRDLTAAIKKGAEEAVPSAIRAGLIPHLPNPYAADLDADLDIRVSVRTGGAEPAVTVSAKARSKARKLRRLDAGLLTHPVFGDREVWRTQQVRPGWFTGPCENASPQVRDEIEKALHDVSDQAVKGNL